MKRRLLEANRSSLSHILGFLYVMATGYQLLLTEYSHGKYSFFYYTSPYKHAYFNTLYILPFNFWGLTLCFGLLAFICGIERKVKLLFRQTLFFGLIVYFFNLLLTLQSDIRYGSFLWPLQNVEFLFKSQYAHLVIHIAFLVFYAYIFKCVLKGSPALGRLSTSLAFLIPLPFIFSFMPLVHAGLLCSGLLLYFIFRSDIKLSSLKTRMTSNPFYLLILIFMVGCFFRLWTLDYFSRTGVHNIPGLAADGPMYYKQAIGFFAGKTLGDLGATPSYGYLLFIFFKLAGFNLVNALTLQGILCSLIPVFIFFIAERIFNFKVALTASACTALSYQLIHYSVVVQRAGMAAFFLVATVLLLIKLTQKTRLDLTLLLGFCLGWTVLLDVVMLPALLLLAAVPVLNSLKTKTLGKYFFAISLGILLAEIPFNSIIYKNEGRVFPLGVNSTEGAKWNQAGLEEGTKLQELGFDPFASFTGSFVSLINNPKEVSQLYMTKSYKELQGYFFDHESFYLDPVLINRETYFSSSLTVYYFPVLLLGALMFFLSKKCYWPYKVILGTPVLYSILIQTFYFHGHARYRAVVQPLILIIFAYGLYRIFQYLTHPQPTHENNIVGFFYKESRPDNIFKKPPTSNVHRLGFIFSGLVAALFIFYLGKTLNRPPYFERKNIIKNAGHHFLWKDIKGQPASLILSAPSLELTAEFNVAVTGNYHIGIKWAKEFGPSLHNFDLEFYLNGILLERKVVSGRPGWLFLENVTIETGHQKFVVKAVATSGRKLEQPEKFPSSRNIRLADMIVVLN